MTDIIAFQAGREARIDGKRRDGRRNADWLHGWDTVDMQERLMIEHGVIDRIECPDCDGSGFTMLTRCCGYALPNGECCGNGTDGKEPCEFCQGEGWRQNDA